MSVRLCILLALFGAGMGLLLMRVVPASPPGEGFIARSNCLRNNAEELRRRGRSDSAEAFTTPPLRARAKGRLRPRPS